MCHEHDSQIVCIKTVLHTESADNHHCDRVSGHVCPTLRKPECRSGGFIDAHTSSSDDILAPLVAEEDVAVRRRNAEPR